MDSDDSDDEPLSVLASAKKLRKSDADDSEYEPNQKKQKKVPSKQIQNTYKLKQKLQAVLPVIERPNDVWMYLKDLKQTGPYSCLLCSEWFINRSKVILHYILNHKKDYCGICRYFVADREAWTAHLKFHAPWPCSQCVDNFPSEATLRQHLHVVHKLIHCRLCHFRVTDEQYHDHLLEKHNITNISSKDDEFLWEMQVENNLKFRCILCSKINISSLFFNHYMGYHHFTMKCLSSIICGKDLPFCIYGADVSPNFVDTLKNHAKFGYVALDQKPLQLEQDSDQAANSEKNNSCNITVPVEMKRETISDLEDTKDDDDDDIVKSEIKIENEEIKGYKGDEDFDVTSMELIILEKHYFDYVKQTLNDINSNVLPDNSYVGYEKSQSEVIKLICTLCCTDYSNEQLFTVHMNKMHGIKCMSQYTCRVCATIFESQSELESHITEELSEFEDLWLCQFCDKEFENRESTRRHLTEHWNTLEYDNCFSPHLGFKCRYCPTLFWNETDRETHQIRVHFNKYGDDFYKCEQCTAMFSDKVWFVYHYLDKHQSGESDREQYLLKCCLCCVVITNVEDMRKHFVECHPEARKIFCSLGTCQYKPLSNRKSFKLHLRTIHNPASRPEKMVSCAVCGREFRSTRACSAHMAQSHGPGSKLRCNICKEVMRTMDERKLHYLLRHPGHHPFECRDCGKSFLYKSSLYMHRQEHAPDKKSFTCSFCGKVFAKKDSYREHVQIHEAPRHACSYCPMRFVQRSNMLRHERRHTGERPYACSHCPRTFADKGACTAHIRTHSKDTSYACVYCGQAFLQKSKLTYHIRKHTGENLESCSVCSKVFTSACSLREHMKIHELKKTNVKCPVCGKKYRDERYMLRHLRTTHAAAHLTCPLCPKRLNTAAALRHHVITHSPLQTFRCKGCSKSAGCKRTIIRHLRKRHGLEPSKVTTRDYYTRLDPRECQLKLDEETMTNIFGPPKKNAKFTKVVTFPDLKEDRDKNEMVKKHELDSFNDSKEGVKKCHIEEHRLEITIKSEIETEEELEPTDFVSVKIEPYFEEEEDH